MVGGWVWEGGVVEDGRSRMSGTAPSIAVRAHTLP